VSVTAFTDCKQRREAAIARRQQVQIGYVRKVAAIVENSVWSRTAASDMPIGHLPYRKYERPVLVRSNTFAASILGSGMRNTCDQQAIHATASPSENGSRPCVIADRSSSWHGAQRTVDFYGSMDTSHSSSKAGRPRTIFKQVMLVSNHGRACHLL
jgi:hypothetical protein